VTTRAFDIDAAIRKIPDHPHPGIVFYDLMPLFQSPAGLTACVDRIAAWGRERQPELVLAAEARGLILGGALAQALGVGVAAARKPGKLPWQTVAEGYELEYGTDALEVHEDAVERGQRVLIVDDVLATGGTASAAAQLVRKMGGDLHALAFLIELQFLNGKSKLTGEKVFSVLQY
jgi:adenine phosphoribosyltransferase